MKQEGRRGGLSLQAWLGKQQGRQEARHKAPFTLRCRLPPPPLLYRLRVSSARCTVLSKDHLGGRWRGRRRDFKTRSTYDRVFLPPSRRLLRSPPTPSASIRDFKRCLMLKTLPRSVFVCLPPSLPSVPLPPSSGFHFAYSICWLLP